MSKDAQRPEECPLRLYELCKHDGGAGRASKAEVAVNSDTPYEFETANFIGHLLFYVSGLPSSPTDLFKGRKRRTHLIVKGRFKRAVSYEDAVTGQRFSKPLKRLPSSWFLELVFMLARRLAPSMQIGCREAPFVLSPLISTAQAISVAKEGDSKDISNQPVEDMSAVGITAEDGKSPLPASKRRRFFNDARKREGREFTPGHTYTFHLYQHMLNCAAWKLDLGFATFDLARHLDGQPLQLMAQRGSDGSYLWRLLLQHKCQQDPPVCGS